MLGSSDSLPAAKGKGRTLPCARRKARAVLDRPPLQGWRTTDEDEVALRRWRGRTGISAVEPIELEQPIFGAFRVHSVSGSVYEVEIRSFESFTNSCGCLDHRANGLGTCKHIEGVLAVLRQGGGRTFRVAAGRGSPRVEVFLDRRGDAAPSLAWSTVGGRTAGAARRFLAPFFGSDGTLARDPKKIETLISAWRVAPPPSAGGCGYHVTLRPGSTGTAGSARAKRRAPPSSPRSERAPRASTCCAARLLPYQREGVLHLAFGERALLARRNGPRKDHPSDCGLRAAGPPQGYWPSVGCLPSVAQGGMGGADRRLCRPRGPLCVRAARDAACRSSLPFSIS